MKVCRCGKEFIPTNGNQIHCSLICAHKYKASREWSDKQRNYKYKLNYGISLENYNELFNLQNGCCKICNRHQTELKGRLHVDHNHETGEIRGLLCGGCNLALGKFNNEQLLDSAKRYLTNGR